jgi:hypothetical protein
MGSPATAGSRQTGLPGSHDPLQLARLRRLAGPTVVDTGRWPSLFLFGDAHNPR